MFAPFPRLLRRAAERHRRSTQSARPLALPCLPGLCAGGRSAHGVRPVPPCNCPGVRVRVRGGIRGRARVRVRTGYGEG